MFLLRDLRFGMRMLLKYRTTSVAVIASLGLAIGACTVAFALMDALLFRPLPVAAPSELINIARVMPGFFSPDNQARETDSFSYPLYQQFHEAAHEDADLFAMNLSGGLQPALFGDAQGASENIRAEWMSGKAFEILGVRPAFGRLIQNDDEAIAVLSYDFWKRRFAGNPAVIGQWVRLGRKQFQIAGIVASGFGGVQPGYLTDVWLPLGVAADARLLGDPDAGSFNVWGRLHGGAKRARVRERLQAVLTNFLRERVRINPPRNLHGVQLQQFTDTPLLVRDASSGRDSLFRKQFRRPLWILGLICGLMLLIACSNVANLMLARASARQTEMAVRLSLGAGRWRLMQQMFMESTAMAALACGAALVFATFAAPAMVRRLGPTEFPAWLDVGMDLRTLAFAVGLTLTMAILFGLAPAMRASGVAPGATLKAGGTQHSARGGFMGWLLAVQVGVSVAVLFLAGLLLLSFRKLIAVDTGFARENVVLFDLAPRDRDNARRDTGTELLERLRNEPAVQAASLSQQRPMGGDMVWVMTPVVRFAGRGNETVRPREVPVSDGFFRAMQMRWIAGRDFLPDEMAGNSGAVIVNQAFVDQFLAGRNPMGQEFEKLTDEPDPVRQRIVGVAGNARYNNLREADRPSIYSPLRNAAGATLNVRLARRGPAVIPWLRRQIETADPALMVRGSILLSTQIDNTMIGERLLALLGGFFSVIALLLSGVGLYGVVNYSVVRRAREMGIRMALGARRGAVMGLLVRGAVVPVLVGVAAGIAGGAGLARFVASQLFGVRPTDGWSLAVPIVCILAVAAMAVIPPAMRAAGADPVVALREE